jgi:nicotinic acid mononucleotide adenylyltransferase
MDAVDVSSSDIRAAIAAKQPPRGLPLVVAELIQSHQVYSSL